MLSMLILFYFFFLGMVWVFPIASVVLLSVFATGSPIKQKDAYHNMKEKSQNNLVLTIHPKHSKSLKESEKLAMIKQINPTNHESSFDNIEKSWTNVLLKDTKNKRTFANLQNNENRLHREPLLALIPVRDRRMWRRRNFQIYNTVPDSRYHFESYAVDPMFYFFGIGK